MDFSAHTATTYQVWTVDRVTGQPAYVYRDDLIYSVAKNWAASWNENAPADVMDGTTFVAVQATTTFQEV